MQVLKRRHNKQIALSLFWSSRRILSIQDGNTSGCCVVFLPWTLNPKSSQITSHGFSHVYFFCSAWSKAVPTLLSSGICVWAGDMDWPGVPLACVWNCFSRSRGGFGPIHACPRPGSLGTSRGQWEGSCSGQGVAGFGSESRCCPRSSPKSSLSRKHSAATASYEQLKPEETWLAT